MKTCTVGMGGVGSERGRMGDGWDGSAIVYF